MTPGQSPAQGRRLPRPLHLAAAATLGQFSVRRRWVGSRAPPRPPPPPRSAPRPRQPYSEAAPGWGSSPPPQTSPNAFAAPPRGRASRLANASPQHRGCSSKSRDLPAPHRHLGLQRLAWERLPVVPMTTAQPLPERQNPPAFCCWPYPKQSPSAGSKSSAQQGWTSVPSGDSAGGTSPFQHQRQLWLWLSPVPTPMPVVL